MMALERKFAWLATMAICLLLLTGGCTRPTEEALEPKIEPEEQMPKIAPEEAVTIITEETVEPEVELEKPLPEVTPEQTITLALKFTPQDLTTYKITTEVERSVKFEGPLPDETAFKGGCTGDKIEMTFTQQIQSVDENGNAVAEITIEGLKYLAKVRDKPVLDFDSSREKDQNSPLAKLIGQGYTIEITPVGRVSKVIDVSSARTAVLGSSSANRAAIRLLSTDAIKQRHAVPVLPDANEKQLSEGDNWSNVRTFSFGMMGSKSYERIYTLKEIKSIDQRRVAVIEMKAIPTSEMAEQLEQARSTFSKMFDNIETYTGQLRLDLTAGKIEECLEELRSEWVAFEPSAELEDDKEPAVLRMTAARLYHLEKID
jgi:hypothetical protein